MAAYLKVIRIDQYFARIKISYLKCIIWVTFKKVHNEQVSYVHVGNSKFELNLISGQ